MMKDRITTALQECFQEYRIKANVLSAKENGCYCKHEVELMPGTRVSDIGILLPEYNEKYNLHMRVVIEKNRLYVITPKTDDSFSMGVIPDVKNGRIPVGFGVNGPVTVGRSLLVLGDNEASREALLRRIHSMMDASGMKTILIDGNSEEEDVVSSIKSVFSESQCRLETKVRNPELALVINDADICIKSTDALRQLIFIARNCEKTSVNVAVSLSHYNLDLGPLLSCAFGETLTFRQEGMDFFNPKARYLIDGEAMVTDSDMNTQYVLCAIER